MNKSSSFLAVAGAAWLAAGSASGQEPAPPPVAVEGAGQEPASGNAVPAPVDLAAVRFDRYSASAKRRIGWEAAGAGAGVLVGVGGSLALAAATCRVEADFGCTAPLLLGVPAGLFLPSIGAAIAGTLNDGAGGYWLSVGGSATGWITAILIWSVVSPQSPGAAAALAVALGALPVGGAVAGYELSSLRALSREQALAAEARLSLAPWFSPNGSRGLVLKLDF